VVDDIDIFFICNRKRRFENLVCSFRIEHKIPELWDADNGTSTPVTIYHSDSGRTAIPLHLQPSGSVFVVFKKAAAGTNGLNTLKRNGKTIISTSVLPVPNPGRYKNLFNNFSQSVWIKPESDIAVTGMNVMRREDVSSFVFSPAQGEVLYGKGHAICGLTAGRNGIVIYERLDKMIQPVYEILKPLEGWTHLTLVYQNGAPKVYLNGVLAGTGPISKYVVHPSAAEEYQDVYSVFFEGDLTTTQFIDRPLLAAEVKQMFLQKRPLSADYPDAELGAFGKSDMIFWKNGTYQLEGHQGKTLSITVGQLKEPLELSGSWEISFPLGSGAPSGTVQLPKLMSLHKHDLEGIRHFSGTATYLNKFNFQQSPPDQEVFLDLGQVEILAEVELNGVYLGILWRKPFRIRLNDAVKSGENVLKIKVTNLWPNRLIGDEQFPEENEYSDKIFEGQKGGFGIKEIPDWFVKGEPKPAGKRMTFSTWKHYQKNDPLLESGLIGPVKIYTGRLLSKTKD
jgi:hypothetical protein